MNRTGRGSGKREFLRGGSIETARFQNAAVRRAVKFPPPAQDWKILDMEQKYIAIMLVSSFMIKY